MNLFRIMFGLCTHDHISWPQTRRKVTTITCLDCARTMPYDWDNMRIETEAETKRRERAVEAI